MAGRGMQRDNETRSSASRFDNYIPAKPFLSLDTFIDGEHGPPSACLASMVSCSCGRVGVRRVSSPLYM